MREGDAQHAACALSPQINLLLEDVKAGRPIRGPTPQVAASPLSPSTAHVIFSSTVSAGERHWTLLQAS